MSDWRIKLHNDKEPPCKGCEERYLGCHGKCEGYQNWLEGHRGRQKALAEKKRTENVIADTYRRSVVWRHWDTKKRR